MDSFKPISIGGGVRNEDSDLSKAIDKTFKNYDAFVKIFTETTNIFKE